jgi:hypothetical protein
MQGSQLVETAATVVFGDRDAVLEFVLIPRLLQQRQPVHQAVGLKNAIAHVVVEGAAVLANPLHRVNEFPDKEVARGLAIADPLQERSPREFDLLARCRAPADGRHDRHQLPVRGVKPRPSAPP